MATPATDLRHEPAVLSLIGNTPLVEITRLYTGRCRLFVKLESQNPGGSIKDRIALSMIDAAERDGRLKPGGTVVEATAGNTGLGLALVARAKGYRVLLVIPDKMSAEKVLHLKALGAEIRMTRSDVTKGHPEYYQDMAQRLAADIPGAFYVNQFGNPANPLAHERTTGPEIWEQMGHDVGAVVCGVGSGGTLTGLTHFFARVSPATEMVLADPAGSVLAPYVETGKIGEAGSWVVEGIGEDFIPPIADLSGVKKAYAIPDAESLATARELLRSELILGGSSAGTLVAAALRYCHDQTEAKRVVTFIPDTGSKYLSKMYNDFWMIDQGFIELPRYGDLRDLVSRRYEAGAIVSVSAEDTLLTAFQRMRVADVSQVPVLSGDDVVGILDESDVLLHVYKQPDRFRDKVATAMTQRLETLNPGAGLADLLAILNKDHVAIIVDDGRFFGLITRYDLLTFLRRSLP
ncbi:MAG: pyridoxal-phosphate dependent enzyme [Betaproteobacteria bacterium]|nr:MAG: pyridoxal-phosphate dependent enzyme [Betaproteobacteria bacterium]